MSQLFTIKGRMGRSNYQDIYLFSLGISAVALGIHELREVVGLGEAAFFVALAGIGVGTIIMLTAAVRRLHDLDRPAWHLLLTLVPVYNLYLILSLLCIKGEAEVNPYGYRPEPL